MPTVLVRTTIDNVVRRMEKEEGGNNKIIINDCLPLE